MTILPPQRWTPTRLVGAAVGFGILYALGASLPFWFLASPSAGAAFFPPAGLTVGTLLLTPRRTWPVWLVTAGLAELMVDLNHGQSLVLASGFVVANVGEPLLGATAVRRITDREVLSVRKGLVVFLGCCVLAAPLFGGAVGASVAVLFGSGHGWFPVFGRWWLGDAIGVLVVATPMLAWTLRLRDQAPFRARETAGLAALATGVTVVPAILWHRPLIFAVLPVLMLAALRGGVRSVSLAGVAVAFAADWAAVTGRAIELVPAVSGDDQLVQVQLFLGVTLLAALVLAVEVDERRRTEIELREAERQRNRAELATIQAAGSEQRRIAREVHDIVGHALNVVLLQAGAARRAMGEEIPKVTHHLEAIEAVGRDAFRDLDLALGLVDRSPDFAPGRGLAFVPELVETMRGAGMSVHLEVVGTRPLVSTIVDWSAYRIIQESLTNVVKHAPRARARVTITYDDERVQVAVVDDGAEVPPLNGNRTGRGLIGIRERASVLGGMITFGPEPAGGFAVVATLPVAGNRG